MKNNGPVKVVALTHIFGSPGRLLPLKLVLH